MAANAKQINEIKNVLYLNENEGIILLFVFFIKFFSLSIQNGYVENMREGKYWLEENVWVGNMGRMKHYNNVLC